MGKGHLKQCRPKGGWEMEGNTAPSDGQVLVGNSYKKLYRSVVSVCISLIPVPEESFCKFKSSVFVNC